MGVPKCGGTGSVRRPCLHVRMRSHIIASRDGAIVTQRSVRYVMKAASDSAVYGKHIAWKSGRREDLSDKFWSYWAKPPPSGDYKCPFPAARLCALLFLRMYRCLSAANRALAGRALFAFTLSLFKPFAAAFVALL